MYSFKSAPKEVGPHNNIISPVDRISHVIYEKIFALTWVTRLSLDLGALVNNQRVRSGLSTYGN